MPLNSVIFRWTAAALAVVTLTACQPVGADGRTPHSAQAPTPGARNGARIYFTASSDRGTAVTYSGGPDIGAWMMGGAMMGGGRWLTCASCHGPEGRGGVHAMHMRLMKAPDIRYAALAAMPELKDRKRAYDLDDFRLTVVDGRHPDGEEIDADMPRWRMSESDLADLFDFLKSLPD